MEFYDRRLPLWHPTGKDILLTWRLHGTLPPNRFTPPDGLTTGQAFGSLRERPIPPLIAPGSDSGRGSLTIIGFAKGSS